MNKNKCLHFGLKTSYLYERSTEKYIFCIANRKLSSTSITPCPFTSFKVYCHYCHGSFVPVVVSSQGSRRKDERLEMHLTLDTSHRFFGQSLGCDKVPDK